MAQSGRSTPFLFRVFRGCLALTAVEMPTNAMISLLIVPDAIIHGSSSEDDSVTVHSVAGHVKSQRGFRQGLKGRGVMLTATIIGSGPNGLSAAITLAAAGRLCLPVPRRPTDVAAHRPSVYRLALKAAPGTFHGEPGCEDQRDDLPVQIRTPATGHHPLPAKPDA